jgi:hypothetical protein
VTSGEEITNFDEDVSPLLEYIWRNGLVPKTSYVGLIEFGSETWHSPEVVTFAARDFRMLIDTSGAAPDREVSRLPVGCCALDSGVATRSVGLQGALLAAALLGVHLLLS